MKIVFITCLLFVAVYGKSLEKESNDVSVEQLRQDVAALKDLNDDDFLLGLFHHAAHAVLGVAAHAVNGITHVLGDENEKDFLLGLIHHANAHRNIPRYPHILIGDQNEKDFLLGLFHHAAHAVLGVAAHAVNGITHVLGDDAMEKLRQDIDNLQNLNDDDFLIGLIHHAAHAVLGVAAHAVNGITHVLGDENEKVSVEQLRQDVAALKDLNDDDFLLGLIHHAAHAVLGVAAHAVNGITHVLGDENEKDFLLGLLHRAHAHRNIPRFPHILLGDQNEKDFLIGLFHHAAHAVLGVAAHAVNGITHVLGDDAMDKLRQDIDNLQDMNDDDFLLGLIHHAAHAVLGVAAHAVNGITHVLGDQNDFFLALHAHIMRHRGDESA